MFLTISAVEKSDRRTRSHQPIFYGHFSADRHTLVNFINAESCILENSHKCTNDELQNLASGDLCAVKVKSADRFFTGTRYVRGEVVCNEGDTILVELPDYVRLEEKVFTVSRCVFSDIPINCIRCFNTDFSLLSYATMPPMGKAFELDNVYNIGTLENLQDTLANEMHVMIPFRVVHGCVNSNDILTVLLDHCVFESKIGQVQQLPNSNVRGGDDNQFESNNLHHVASFPKLLSQSAFESTNSRPASRLSNDSSLDSKRVAGRGRGIAVSCMGANLADPEPEPGLDLDINENNIKESPVLPKGRGRGQRSRHQARQPVPASRSNPNFRTLPRTHNSSDSCYSGSDHENCEELSVDVLREMVVFAETVQDRLQLLEKFEAAIRADVRHQGQFY